MDRAEATGVGVAVVGHAGLFAILMLGLARTGSPPLSGDPIEVSFVEEVGLTAAAPEPVISPPEQGMAPQAGPPEDAAPATPEPAPPVAQPQRPAASPQPKQSRAVREPVVRPQARNSGSAETDRRPRLGRDILKNLGTDPAPRTAQRAPAAMTGEARASINSAIRRALLPCERQPLPSPEAASIEVDVRVTLTREGGLAEANVLRVRNDDPSLEIYERRMRDLALNVVRQCTPIRGLPGELYDVPRGWRQFTYTFDPRQS